MDFDFMHDSRWNGLDDNIKKAMIDVAFEDNITSNSKWKDLTPEVQTTMRDMYHEDAREYEKGLEKDTGFFDKAISAPIEYGKGIIAGVRHRLPEMVGQAGQFLGIETGKELVEWGREGEEQKERGAFYQAGEMTVPSMAIPAALNTLGTGIMFLPLPGARPVGGALKVASYFLTPAMFGLSQAQQTKETAEARGMEPGAAPYITGGIEMGGETIANTALLRLLGPLAPTVPLVKAGARNLLKSTIGQYGKTLVTQTLPAEVVTEIGQQFGEAQVEKAYDIRPDAKPIKEAMSVIAPTAIMTLVTGTAGRGAQVYQANTILKALKNPDANPKVREDAVNAVAGIISSNEDGEEKPVANLWLHYAHNQINNNQPIDIDTSITKLEIAKKKEQPVKDITQAPNIDEAINAFNESVNNPEIHELERIVQDIEEQEDVPSFDLEEPKQHIKSLKEERFGEQGEISEPIWNNITALGLDKQIEVQPAQQKVEALPITPEVKALQKAPQKIVGYRSEDIAAIGKERGLKKVVTFETEELGNTDILPDLTREERDAYIDNLEKQGYKKVVWLSESPQAVRDVYGFDEYHKIESIDKYEIEDGIVLSDLGDDGRLIAYKGEPKITGEEEQEQAKEEVKPEEVKPQPEAPKEGKSASGLDIKTLSKKDIETAKKQTPEDLMLHPPSIDELVFYNNKKGDYIGMAIRWGDRVGFVEKRENSIDTAESRLQDYKEIKAFSKVKKSIATEKPEAPKAKEPWEMTRDEWKDKGIREYGYTPEQSVKWDTMATRVFNREAHKWHIGQALSEGKLTPERAIELHKADYPDIESWEEMKGEVDNEISRNPKISKTKVKIGDSIEERYAVSAPERMGFSRGMGDTLYKTYEEAKRGLESQERREEEYREREKEQKEIEIKNEAEKKKREDIGGFAEDVSSVQKGKIVSVLNKRWRFEGKEDSLKNHINRLVEEGAELTTREENRIKPMSRTRYNRASNKEQEAHEKKIKAGGTVTIYSLGDFDIGKIAYDYAKYLKSKSTSPETLREQVEEPQEKVVEAPEVEEITPKEQPTDVVELDYEAASGNQVKVNIKSVYYKDLQQKQKGFIDEILRLSSSKEDQEEVIRIIDNKMPVSVIERTENGETDVRLEMYNTPRSIVETYHGDKNRFYNLKLNKVGQKIYDEITADKEKSKRRQEAEEKKQQEEAEKERLKQQEYLEIIDAQEIKGKRGQYKIRIEGNKTELKNGTIYDDLAVSPKEGRVYEITHIPTGKQVVDFKTKKEVTQFIKAVKHSGLDISAKDVDRDTLTKLKEIVEFFRFSGGVPSYFKNEPKYRKTKTKSSGTKAIDLQNSVGEIAKKLEVKPPIHFIQSQDELPENILTHHKETGGGIIQGVLEPESEEIYLIADNLSSIQEAEETLFHELYGHYGARKLFGKDFEPLLARIYMSYGSKLEKVGDVEFDLSTKEGRLKAAEEKLAEIAEKREKPTLLDRVYTFIREWLRKTGFSLKLNDNDLQNIISRKVKPYLERGEFKETKGEHSKEPMFSKKEDSLITEAKKYKTAEEFVKDSLSEVKLINNPSSLSIEDRLNLPMSKVKELENLGEKKLKHITSADKAKVFFRSTHKEDFAERADEGIFFSNDIGEAKQYSGSIFKTEPSKIQIAKLDIKNPYYATKDEIEDHARNREKWVSELKKKGHDSIVEIPSDNPYDMGYGVIPAEVAVFDKSQVKEIKVLNNPKGRGLSDTELIGNLESQLTDIWNKAHTAPMYSRKQESSQMKDINEMYLQAIDIAEKAGNRGLARKYQRELEFIGGSITKISDLRRLQNRIDSWVNYKGLTKKALSDIIEKVTGFKTITENRIKNSEVTADQLKEIIGIVAKERPGIVDKKNVITKKTEKRIQTLKNNLSKDNAMTDEAYEKVLETVHAQTDRYISKFRFITETQGKEIINRMLKISPVVKLETDITKGRETSPGVKDVAEDIEKGFKRTDNAMEHTRTYSLLDMHHFADAMEKLTGIPFGKFYQAISNKKHEIEYGIDEQIHELAKAGGKDFQKIIKDKKAVQRINDYVTSRLPEYYKGVPKQPKDITKEEEAIAKEIIDGLKRFEGDVRYNRFFLWREQNIPIPNAPDSELEKATAIFETKGHEALREWLKGRSWGVIKSGYGAEEVLNPKVKASQHKPGFGLRGLLSRLPMMPVKQERDILKRYASYVRSMTYRTELRPLIDSWTELFEDNRNAFAHPQKISELLTRNVKEVLGQKDNLTALEEYTIRLYSQAARTIFLDIRKGIRNLFQNMAFYSDPTDLLRGAKLSKEDKKYFDIYVSQSRGIQRDWLYQDYEGLPGFAVFNKIADYINVMGRSDTINRLACFKAKLGAVKRAIKNHPDYKTDKKELLALMKESKWGDIERMEQVHALNELAVNGEDAMARYIANAYTKKVHFLYERSERSPAEQGSELTRVLSNLFTFRKGYVQRLILDTKKLKADETQKDIATRKQALKSLSGVMIMGGFASWLYMALTGDDREPYRPDQIIGDLSLGGLATGMQEQVGELSRDMMGAVTGDKAALGRVINGITRSGDTFIPFYDEAINAIEGLTDYRFIDKAVLRQIRGELDKRYEAKPLSYYKRNRSPLEVAQHIAFGTKNESMREVLKEEYKELKESGKSLTPLRKKLVAYNRGQKNKITWKSIRE